MLTCRRRTQLLSTIEDLRADAKLRVSHSSYQFVDYLCEEYLGRGRGKGGQVETFERAIQELTVILDEADAASNDLLRADGLGPAWKKANAFTTQVRTVVHHIEEILCAALSNEDIRPFHRHGRFEYQQADDINFD